MENEKFIIDLKICKHIFQILEILLKLFMSPIMSIATSIAAGTSFSQGGF